MQISAIEELLHSDNTDELIKEYENKMALLIGSGHGISFASARMGFYILMKINTDLLCSINNKSFIKDWFLN